MQHVLVSFELCPCCSYDALFQRLRILGADPKTTTTWWLRTGSTVKQIKRDLSPHLQPTDRILVAYVGEMSSRNLID